MYAILINAHPRINYLNSNGHNSDQAPVRPRPGRPSEKPVQYAGNGLNMWTSIPSRSRRRSCMGTSRWLLASGRTVCSLRYVTIFTYTFCTRGDACIHMLLLSIIILFK